jgi:hypothetical protein
MKKILFTLTLVPLLTFGQSWLNFYGDSDWGGSTFIRTTNDSYLMGGNNGSIPNLSKINSEGNLIWTKTYLEDHEAFQSIEGFGQVKFIEPINDGGFVIGVWVSDQWKSNTNYIMTIDENGNIQSSFTIECGFSIVSLKQSQDGNYVVLDYNMNLLKVDPLGNILWDYNFGSGSAAYNHIWGPDYLQNTSDGGFIFTGYENEDTGNINAIVNKTDSNGILEWSYSLTDALGVAVQETDDGNYLCLSQNQFTSNDIPQTITLTKLGLNGNYLWSNIFDNSYSIIAMPFDFKVINNGGTIVAGGVGSYDLDGSFIMNGYLLKTDDLGNVLWSKKYLHDTDGDWEHIISVCETNDGGFIMWCQSRDYLVIRKTDSEGNLSSREIINLNENKTLLKTIDILGRDSENKPFTPLIDLYDDGSAKKRMIIE